MDKKCLYCGKKTFNLVFCNFDCEMKHIKRELKIYFIQLFKEMKEKNK